VSIVILSVGMLGLLQSVNYSIDHNMNTQLRDEAVRLADERMTTEKSRVFDAISTTTKSEQVKVNVNNAFKNYSVVKSATNLSGSSNTKIVQIDVVWKYKKARYSHIISSLVSKSIH
jgi:type IV pilus assembly protein PilV